MKKYKQTGFSLIELMVVVAMMGVVAAIGVPTYQSMTITNQVVGVTNDLIAAFKMARFKAIERGVDAIVCSSSDGIACSGANNVWSTGWIVGLDINGDGVISEANGELLWVRMVDQSYGIEITSVEAASSKRVVYSYNGWLSAKDPIGFEICSGYGATDGYPARVLHAGINGQVTLEKKDLTNRC